MCACYLDGRYFNIVLDAYPGLVRKPITVELVMNAAGEVTRQRVKMKFSFVSQEFMLLTRCVIVTPKSRHSTLIMIDPKRQYCWWWDPNTSENPKLHAVVGVLLREYLVMFMPKLAFREIGYTVKAQHQDGCLKSGFCNAYVLNLAECWLSDRLFDPHVDIKSYANTIINEHRLPDGDPDVEYGVNGALVGGLGGLAIGGIVGGAGGALVGGLSGAALGGIITRHNTHESTVEPRFQRLQQHDKTQAAMM